MSVSSAQRFTQERTCPVCHGFDQANRGSGMRCFGFLSEDGQRAHCTREEQAGHAKRSESSETWAHKLQGACPCGSAHGLGESPIRKGARGQIVDTYDYVDESGLLIYQAVRFEPKGFAQRRPDGKEGWTWDLAGVPRLLYRLPQLIGAPANSLIFVTEGERDCDRLRNEGLLSTCNSGGAGKFGPELVHWFKSHRVVVLEDNDEAGRRHVEKVAALLQQVAEEVKVVSFRELPKGGDVSDWLDAGHTVDELKANVQASPEFRPEPSSHGLKWHTAQDIANMTSEEPDWIIPGLLARGSISELSAKIKVGKTQFAMSAVEAICRGGQFLGRSAVKTPVVYLTEERPPTFGSVLRRVGLEGSENLTVLLRQDARGLKWSEVVLGAVAKAQEVGAGVLVVDTVSDWAEIPGEGENASGVAYEAMRPLQDAAAGGLAVWVVRHDRKSGGELGDSSRGSSAFAGAADILLALRRANTAGHESRRILDGVGRFDDVLSKTLIELGPEAQYVVLGNQLEVERQEVKKAVLDILPRTFDAALTTQELLGNLGERASKSTLNRVLKELVEAGFIERRKGKGSRGSAFGYFLSNIYMDPEKLGETECVKGGEIMYHLGGRALRCGV